MQFSKAKDNVLHVGQGNAKQKGWLGREWIESSCEEKDLGELIDEKLSTTQQYVLIAQKVNCVLGCIKRNVARRHCMFRMFAFSEVMEILQLPTFDWLHPEGVQRDLQSVNCSTVTKGSAAECGRVKSMLKTTVHSWYLVSNLEITICQCF
ncbi:hypothetical protein WISP_107887 [Willisornis vidua]|uniref:Uncharacterized protein n=1 Tax=Willisornis vidua TaxID=1566151 RepID=A0ABQ9D2K1_9PASS|nr:hypothetical protein WISP_107887 [Willisornis vidua]